VAFFAVTFLEEATFLADFGPAFAAFFTREVATFPGQLPFRRAGSDAFVLAGRGCEPFEAIQARPRAVPARTPQNLLRCRRVVPRIQHVHRA
jgi:hypothetical protein